LLFGCRKKKKDTCEDDSWRLHLDGELCLGKANGLLNDLVVDGVEALVDTFEQKYEGEAIGSVMTLLISLANINKPEFGGATRIRCANVSAKDDSDFRFMRLQNNNGGMQALYTSPYVPVTEYFPLMRELLDNRCLLTPEDIGRELFKMPGVEDESKCFAQESNFLAQSSLPITAESRFFDFPSVSGFEFPETSPKHKDNIVYEERVRNITPKKKSGFFNMLLRAKDLEVVAPSFSDFDSVFGYESGSSQNGLFSFPQELPAIGASSSGNSVHVGTGTSSSSRHAKKSLPAVGLPISNLVSSKNKDVIQSGLLVLRGVPSELFPLGKNDSKRGKSFSSRFRLCKEALRQRLLANGLLENVSCISKLLTHFSNLGTIARRLQLMSEKLTDVKKNAPATFVAFGTSVSEQIREYLADLEEKHFRSSDLDFNIPRTLLKIERRLRDGKWYRRLPALGRFCGVADSCSMTSSPISTEVSGWGIGTRAAVGASNGAPALPRAGSVLLEQLYHWCEMDIENVFTADDESSPEMSANSRNEKSEKEKLHAACQLIPQCKRIFDDASKPMRDSLKHWVKDEQNYSATSIAGKQMAEFVRFREAGNQGQEKTDLWRDTYLASVSLQLPAFAGREFAKELKLVGCLRRLLKNAMREGRNLGQLWSHRLRTLPSTAKAAGKRQSRRVRGEANRVLTDAYSNKIAGKRQNRQKTMVVAAGKSTTQQRSEHMRTTKEGTTSWKQTSQQSRKSKSITGSTSGKLMLLRPKKLRKRRKEVSFADSDHNMSLDGCQYELTRSHSTTKRITRKVQKKSVIVETDIHSMKKKEQTVIEEFTEIIESKNNIIHKNYKRRKYGEDHEFAVHDRNATSNLNKKELSDAILGRRGVDALLELENGNSKGDVGRGAVENSSKEGDTIQEGLAASDSKNSIVDPFAALCESVQTVAPVFPSFHDCGGGLFDTANMDFDAMFSAEKPDTFFSSLLKGEPAYEEPVKSSPNSPDSTRCESRNDATAEEDSDRGTDVSSSSHSENGGLSISRSTKSAVEKTGTDESTRPVNLEDEKSDLSVISEEYDDGKSDLSVISEESHLVDSGDSEGDSSDSEATSDENYRGLTVRQHNRRYTRKVQTLQKQILDQQIQEKADARKQEENAESNLRKMVLQGDAQQTATTRQVLNLLGQPLNPIIQPENVMISESGLLNNENPADQNLALAKPAFGTHEYYVSRMAEDYRNHIAQVENASRLLEWKLERMRLKESREHLHVETEVRDKLAVEEMIDERRKMLQKLEKYGTGGAAVTNDEDALPQQEPTDDALTQQHSELSQQEKVGSQVDRAKVEEPTLEENKAEDKTSHSKLETVDDAKTILTASGVKIKRVSAKRVSMDSLRKVSKEDADNVERGASQIQEQSPELVPLRIPSVQDPLQDGGILVAETPELNGRVDIEKQELERDLLRIASPVKQNMSPIKQQNMSPMKRHENALFAYKKTVTPTGNGNLSEMTLNNVIPRFIPKWRSVGVSEWLRKGVQWEYDFGWEYEKGYATGSNWKEDNIPARSSLPSTREDRLELYRALPAAGMATESLGRINNTSDVLAMIRCDAQTSATSRNHINERNAQKSDVFFSQESYGKSTTWTTSNIFSTQFSNFLELNSLISKQQFSDQDTTFGMGDRDVVILRMAARDMLQQTYAKCITMLLKTEERHPEERHPPTKDETSETIATERVTKTDKDALSPRSLAQREFLDPVSSETDCSSSDNCIGLGHEVSKKKGSNTGLTKIRRKKFRSLYPKMQLQSIYAEYAFLNPKLLKEYRAFSSTAYFGLMSELLDDSTIKMVKSQFRALAKAANLPAFFLALHGCLSYGDGESQMEMDDYVRNLAEHESEIRDIPSIISYLLPENCKKVFSLSSEAERTRYSHDVGGVKTTAPQSGGASQSETTPPQCLHDVLVASSVVFTKQHPVFGVFLSSSTHTPVLAHVFKVMTSLKVSRHILRDIWLWLYKSNIDMAYSDVRKDSSISNQERQRLNKKPGDYIMPVSFSRSGAQRSLLHVVYIKLGVLRHHMQHFATFLEQYLLHDVSQKVWAKFHRALKQALSNSNKGRRSSSSGQSLSKEEHIFPHVLHNLYEGQLLAELRKLTWFDVPSARDAMYVLIRLISELRDVLYGIGGEKDWINPKTLNSLKDIDSRFHRNKKILQREMRKVGGSTKEFTF